MKKSSILFLLVLFTFGVSSVSALEVSEAWTEYEMNSITIEVDKLKEFEDKLSYRVNELNRLNLDKVYRYRIETTTEDGLEDYLEIVNDITFDSEEEALEWADNNEPEVDGWSFIENIVESFSLEKIFDLM